MIYNDQQSISDGAIEPSACKLLAFLRDKTEQSK